MPGWQPGMPLFGGGVGPPAPPPTNPTQVGAYVHQNAGENAAQALTRYNNAVAPQASMASRIYDSGAGPSNVSTTLGILAGASLQPALYCSSNEAFATILAGTNDAAYNSLFSTMNSWPGGPHNFTWKQEMDQGGGTTGPDSGWNASPPHHSAVLKHLGVLMGSSYPNVRLWTVFTSTNFASRLNSFWTQYVADGTTAYIKGIGWDPYISAGSAGESLQTRISGLITTSLATFPTGLVGCWETGQEGYGSGVTDLEMENYITSLQWGIGQVEPILWFNSTFNGDLDITAHAGWSTAMSGTIAAA